MLAKWCETASCHGIINLYQARNNKPLFVIWAIIMMGMAVASVYFTYKIIKGYVDSPYSTTIENISNASLVFPEIAIAYNGGVDVNAFGNTNFSEHFIHVYQHDLSDCAYCTPYYNPLSRSQAKFQLLEYMDQENLTRRTIYTKFAFSCEYIIQGISNNGRYFDMPCTALTNTILTRSKTVFMFKNIGYQDGTGPDSGLTLNLRSPVSSYANHYPNETSRSSLDKDFLIWIEMTLDNVRGTYYRIPINSIVNIQLVPKLYQMIPALNKCRSNVTTDLCAGLCTLTSFKKYNNCTKLDYVDIYNTNDSDICLPFTDIAFRTSDDVVDCISKCLPNCNQWKYDPMITFSPIYGHKENDDYSTVTVIHNALQYLKISEVQSFTYDMAIANVGGQIGLWLGASIVTIVEAFYYLTLMVTNQSHTIHPVKKIKVQDSLEQWLTEACEQLIETKFTKVQDSLEQRLIKACEQLIETKFNLLKDNLLKDNLLKDMLTKIADETEQNKSNDNM